MPYDHAGLYDGSTTFARVGITSHIGSMFIFSGSEGKLILEIFNASEKAFLLQFKMRIGQILFMKLDSPVQNPQPALSSYQGKNHFGLVLHDRKRQ